MRLKSRPVPITERCHHVAWCGWDYMHAGLGLSLFMRALYDQDAMHAAMGFFIMSVPFRVRAQTDVISDDLERLSNDIKKHAKGTMR